MIIGAAASPTSSANTAAGKSTGSSEISLFRWLDPQKPQRARKRIGDIYWMEWDAFVRGFYLAGFGVTFLFVAALGIFLDGDFIRGSALLSMGSMLCIPGVFSLSVLWRYIRGGDEGLYIQLLSK